jgi:hypothetical protein
LNREFSQGKRRELLVVFLAQGVIRLRHLIRGKQMVKCSKAEVRGLKTALRWKIPAAQRQRIQMVLLRESGMTQPLRRRWVCR